jgi:hypothetical protein
MSDTRVNEVKYSSFALRLSNKLQESIRGNQVSTSNRRLLLRKTIRESSMILYLVLTIDRSTPG